LVTPGEFLALGGEPVDTPTVSVDCSTLTVENATPEVEIKWYRDGLVIPGENKNNLSALVDGVYSVSFENSCDLKYGNDVEIKKNEKVSVPLYNVITVNGDGKNDYYVVDSRLSGSKLQIFNRWGEIVYSSESYQNDWLADQLSPGMYFYHIQSPCYGEFKGPLTVLKP
jgi:gliding motility-associated-like protein